MLPIPEVKAEAYIPEAIKPELPGTSMKISTSAAQCTRAQRSAPPCHTGRYTVPCYHTCPHKGSRHGGGTSACQADCGDPTGGLKLLVGTQASYRSVPRAINALSITWFAFDLHKVRLQPNFGVSGTQISGRRVKRVGLGYLSPQRRPLGPILLVVTGQGSTDTSGRPAGCWSSMSSRP